VPDMHGACSDCPIPQPNLVRAGSKYPGAPTEGHIRGTSTVIDFPFTVSCRPYLAASWAGFLTYGRNWTCFNLLTAG